MRADGVGRAVREDGRRDASGPAAVIGAAQDVAHSVWADVGEVDDHAQAVHLLDQVATDRGDAAPVRRASDALATLIGHDGGVGIDVMAVPSEGGVAHSELVVESEGGDGVADLVKSFDDNRGDVATFLERTKSRGTVGCRGEVLGIFGPEALIKIQLLQSGLDNWTK